MERSSEVEGVVGELFAALKSGDVDGFVGRLDDDVTSIGTDPAEWWDGKEDASRAFREQAEALGGGFPIEPGSFTAYEHGDVAWAAGRPAFLMGDDRVDCRWTGTLSRASGDWKLVLSHISIGVGNEEALGEELPT